MTSLHLVSGTSTDCQCRCINAVAVGDTVLFHAEGVLNAMPSSVFLQQLQAKGVQTLALEPDCRERGVQPTCPPCTYAQWVELVERHPRTITWS